MKSATILFACLMSIGAIEAARVDEFHISVPPLSRLNSGVPRWGASRTQDTRGT
jgi:hypothetical protein